MIKLAHIVLIMLAATSMISAQDDLVNTSINITTPQDGEMVSVQETIRGTSSGIPEGYELWIYVNPLIAGRFHIQDKGRTMLKDGRWSGLAYIGRDDSSDSGLEFDIYAVLADERANKTISDDIAQGRATGVWDGREQLPTGATIMDLVTVVRQ